MSIDPLVAQVDLVDGGRITALRDRVSGRDWLAHDPRPGRAPRRPATPFVDTALGGWDEIAPSVDACVVDTADGPWRVGDHGELWSRPWTGDASAHEVGASRFLLHRSIAATDTGLRLDYRVTPTGPHRLPFLWTAHPQFRVHPGTRLVLPGPVPVRRVQPGPPRRQTWPDTVDPVAVTEPGTGAKWWVDPTAAAVGWAALLDADRGWLRLRWDTVDLPYFGVWVDRGCYADGEVIALEPSTGWYDRLDRAMATGRVWTLDRTPRSWTVHVDVGRDGDPRLPPPAR